MEFLKPHIEAYMAVIKKYIVFEGRARRREFWMFCLYNIIIGVALGILSFIPFIGRLFGFISSLYGLAIFLPSLAVGTRRLHDTNRTGWLQLLLLLSIIPSIGVIFLIFNFNPWPLVVGILISLVGMIILIVFWVQAGNTGSNKYGSDPKAGGTRKPRIIKSSKSKTRSKTQSKKRKS